MDTEGTYDARGARRDAAPPPTDRHQSPRWPADAARGAGDQGAPPWPPLSAGPAGGSTPPPVPMAAPLPSQPPGPPYPPEGPRQQGVPQRAVEVPAPPTSPPPAAAGPTPGGLPPIGGQPYLTGPPNVSPPVPAGPPGAPPAQHPFLEWLRTPRRLAEPGIWAFGYRPKPPEEPDRIPTPRLVGGAVVAALCAWLLWSMLYDGFLGGYWYWPMYLLTPGTRREAVGWDLVGGRCTSMKGSRILRDPGPFRPRRPLARTPAPPLRPVAPRHG